MQVAHPVSRHAAEAGAAYSARLLAPAELCAQAVRHVTKLPEGE